MRLVVRPTPILLAGALAIAAPARADLAEIKQAGVLRVLVVEANSPLPGRSPFLALEGETVTGFDADVLTAFARAQGLKLGVRLLGSWEQLVPALLAGQGDVAGGNVTASESRRALIDFTGETLPTRTALVSYPPAGPILALDQVGTQKVGAVKGTAPLESLLQAGLPRASVDDSLTTPALLEALHGGRLLIAAMDLMAAAEAQRRDPKLQIGMFVGPPGSLAYGVRKDCPRLRQALSAHVLSLKNSPNWYRMLVGHFGSGAPAVLARLHSEARP